MTPEIPILFVMSREQLARCITQLSIGGFAAGVHAVNSMADLRKELARTDWSLVVSDASPDGRPFEEVLKCVRDGSQDAPVIALQPESAHANALALIRAGAADCVAWNDLAELPRAVERALAVTARRRERFQLEAQFHHVQRQELIGVFAGSVAHDLNNLLTAISGSAELMRSAVEGHAVASKAMNTLERAIDQAASVIGGLMTFCEKPIGARDALDLHAVVTETVNRLRPLLPRGIDLLLEADAPERLTVEADRVQFEQVLLNLVLNARDAMPAGGTLRVKLEASTDQQGTDWVRLSVQDSGRGMTEEETAQIFEPVLARRARGQRPALGLAVVQSILKSHDGRLKVTSAPGEGSLFVVELPRSSSMDRPSPGLAPAAVAGRGETILLAESRPYIREIVASALAAAGYRVIQVNDSAAAQQFVAGADGKVDMLVLDADGHRSGVEALAAMRESGIDAPAVLTTTQADMSLEGPAAERTLVLRKPFQVSELTRIIRGMLSHHASAPLLAPE